MDAVIDRHRMWFNTLTGQVASVQKWSSTTVTSSGGGGYIHPQYGGVVSAPTISSNVQNHQTFWIVAPDGQEIQIDQGGIKGDFPCREGQSVSVIWGGKKGRQNGKYLALRNNMTHQISYFSDNDYTEAFSEIGASWLKLTAFYALFIVAYFFALLVFMGEVDHRNHDGDPRAALALVLFAAVVIGGFFHAYSMRRSLLIRYRKYVSAMLDKTDGTESVFGRTEARGIIFSFIVPLLPSVIVLLLSFAYAYHPKNDTSPNVVRESPVSMDNMKE
jgi:hypothetical protein